MRCDGKLTGYLTPTGTLCGELTVIGGGGGTPYAGPYIITPSEDTQVLNTTGLKMTDNVTVEPIPENYGLITWNGSVLTVS